MRKVQFSHLSVLSLLVVGAIGCSEQSGPPLPNESDASVDAGMQTNALKITSPASGATITVQDDLDISTDGYQIKVTASLPRGVFGDAILTVNGSDPVNQPIGGDTIEFDVTLPSQMNNSYVLAVKATAVDGTEFSDSVTVNVRVEGTSEGCMVQLEPAPLGGCDIIGPEGDEDATQPFVQKTFTARTDCPSVSFTVNGRPGLDTQVIDGVATRQLTLDDGDNQVTIIAKDDAGNTFPAGPFTYGVKTILPRFSVSGPDGRDLNEARTNTYFLDSGTTAAGAVFWTISGTVQGALAGGDVTIALEGDREGQQPTAPARVRTDAQGNFRFDVEIAAGAFWSGSLTMSASDACMQVGQSSAYAVQLDAVTPEVRIVSPGDDSLLVASQDVDPNRAGVQIPVTVELIDVRPSSVDYEITIECAAVSQNRTFIDRATGNDTVTRSALNDGEPNNDKIIVTFLSTEQGEFLCRPKIVAQSNPLTATTSVWRTFFSQPTLTVIQPSLAPRCIESNDVQVTALGGNLEGNQPSLSVSVTPEGGMMGDALPLQPAGSEEYRYTFDSATLPDGRYTLNVSGTILGSVPVEVSPENIEIIVDRTPVTVEILSPAANGTFSDVQPETPGTQAIIQARVCGGAGQKLNIEFVASRAFEPLAIDIPDTGEDCVEVSSEPLSMPLGSVDITASATDACNRSASDSVTASTGVNEARIVTPENGVGVNSSSDRDLARGGCQIIVEAIAGGVAEGADFAVCTNVSQGPASELCQGRTAANDQACTIVGSTANGARVQCAVTLQEEEHTLTFVGQFGERIESPPIVVSSDCSVPTVSNVQVVQDGNEDGCINAAETGDGGGNPDAAQVTINFETTGLANDRPFEIRDLGGAVLGAGSIVNNSGNVTVSLAQGTQRFYVAAADAAGNALPTPNSDVFSPSQITIDTVVPEPSLDNLSSARCLLNEDDANPVDGFQYDIRINTGRSENEAVTARLVIDGNDGTAQSVDESADQITFDTVEFDEGSHSVTVTVADGCGNQGSVSGFSDQNEPNPVSVVVDTQAPVLALSNIVNGAQLEAQDDADGDASNGFQVDVDVVFTPFDGIEAGQSIDILVNGGPTSTSPAAVVVPDNLNGPIPVAVTISPGDQVLTATATDTCGNTGSTAPVGLQLNIAGCTSVLTGFNANPTYFGIADGANGQVIRDITGTVELFDASCATANVDLLDNGNVIASTQVGAGGDVSFAQLAFTPGSHTLQLRVTAGNEAPILSPSQGVTVDLTAPTVSVLSPEDGAYLSSNGTISVTVTENVGTARTAQLLVDGQATGNPQAFGDDPSVVVSFNNQGLTPGDRQLGVCATDLAGNQGCADWQVKVDDGVPGAPIDVSGVINDVRETNVTINLTVPAEDGEGIGGAVTAFEVRRLAENFDGDGDSIPDDLGLTLAAWDEAAAATTALVEPNQAAVNAQIVINIVGPGPGPGLADGLPLDDTYFLAIRARDDVGRLSEPRLVAFDLRLARQQITFAGTGGATLAKSTPPIANVGDVDGDGFTDVLVTLVVGNTSKTAVVFGGPSEDPLLSGDLVLAPTVSPTFFGFGAGAVGDVNGDGRPDFGVMGFSTEGFGTSAISIYFGSDNRQDALEPDAVIYVSGVRTVVTGAGKFIRTLAGADSFDDVFIGSDNNGAQDRFAFVVAGRANWPDVNTPIRVGTDSAQNDDGITVLDVPDGQKTGWAAANVGDITGTGVSSIAFSAGLPTTVYVFDGRNDAPKLITYDPAPDAMGNPSKTRVLPQTCSSDNGFGEEIVGGVDLDGDANGRPDFLVSNGIGKRVMVVDQDLNQLDCLGRSENGFGDRMSIVGDINGDGHQDIAVSHYDPEKTDAYVFYNNGDGTFGSNNVESPRLYDVRLDQPALRKLGIIGVGDFNNDQTDDIGVLVQQPNNGDFQLIIYTSLSN